jgi:hypothetical protein
MNLSDLFAIQALLLGNLPATKCKGGGFAQIGETRDG